VSRFAGSLEGVKPAEVEAAWAALAGASACLGGLILDQSGRLDDAIDEPERTQAKAALLDAQAARDASLIELRVVVRDGLAGADGLADVLSLDDGGLVPLASRLRAGFEAVAQALPSN
jgi:hypothetical protein